MGIIVDAGAMAGEVEQINAMLSTAKGAIAGCASAIGAFALDSELSGAAYMGAKLFFAAYLPALDAVSAQIDSVQLAGQSVMSALGACPDLGYGNEDVLLEEKEALLREREELGNMADNAYCAVIIDGVKQYVEDTAFRNSCMADIALIDEKLEKIDRVLEQLRDFNGCGAFAGMEAACDALMTSVGAICSGAGPGFCGTGNPFKDRFTAMKEQLGNLKTLSTPSYMGTLYTKRFGDLPIFVPKNGQSIYDDGWTDVGLIPGTRVLTTPDWGLGWVTFWGGVSEGEWIKPNPTASAGSVALGLVNGVGAAVQSKYVDAKVQEKDGQQRVVLLAGNTATENFYEQYSPATDKNQRYEAYVWQNPDGTTQGRPIIYQHQEGNENTYVPPQEKISRCFGTLYLNGHAITHGNGDRPLPQYDFDWGLDD